MDTILRDVRHALRGFRRHPGLILVGCLSLALGIAINVTMFAGVITLLWQPLPYPNPDQLIQVWQVNKERGFQSSLSTPNFFSVRERARQVALVAYSSNSFNFADQEKPERLSGMRVSDGFFPQLGARMVLGKGIGRSEEAAGVGKTAVISHRLWTRRFDADSALVGRSVLLDGEPYEVLGVLAPDFRFEGEDPIDVYVPLVDDPAASRASSFLRVFGRLASAATRETANAELDRIGAALAAEYPTVNRGMGFNTFPMIDEVVEDGPRQAGLVSLVAVAFVLLIACANVANLLLARATGRDRELAVRSAMGADRGRLIRSLLTESLVLATLGGVLGLALSFVGLGWLRSVIPADFPRIDNLVLDWRAFGYAAAITVVSGLAFGVAPAWRASRPSLVSSLRDGARGMTGLRHGKVLSILVGFEVALALVLLISAGLLIKSSLMMASVDPGFVPTGTLTFRTALAEREYPDTASVVRFQERLLSELRAIGEVSLVGGASQLPMGGRPFAFYWVDGEPEPEPGKAPFVQVRWVTSEYTEAMGIGLIAGRTVATTDRAEGERVVVVNEAFAARHWPAGSPLGRGIHASGQLWQIVGVVRGTRDFGPDDPSPPVIYFPAAQGAARNLSFVLRTTGSPVALTEPIRAAMKRIAPTQPIFLIETLVEQMDRQLAGSRIMPRLLTVFGGMALLLAIIGVYGVMSYSVAQRTQEMGVRRALGAPDRSITTMILRESGIVCGIGGVVGLVLAALTTRALSVFLYGVSAFDPAIFAGVTVALIGAALGASAIPALRATRVDPIQALRAD